MLCRRPRLPHLCAGFVQGAPVESLVFAGTKINIGCPAREDFGLRRSQKLFGGLTRDAVTREDLQPLLDSLFSRITGWRGKLLSSEAKNPY
jgi:hypothetical protein